MYKKKIIKWIVSMVTISVLAAGSVYAESVQETQELEEKVFGEERENAVRFEFENGTGKDITFFCISTDGEDDRETVEIRSVQNVLIEKGFLDDIADGIYGPKTEAAVKAYCEENGISAEDTTIRELLRLFYSDGMIQGQNGLIKKDEHAVIYYLNSDKMKKWQTNF